ncbi:MAG: hypothetical protein K2H29_00795 [Oscillospiraceae bacterium]|nr:hypothetical protein [Oscillospiraceae bacterium]
MNRMKARVSYANDHRGNLRHNNREFSSSNVDAERSKREFDEKNIEKNARICYNENNYRLKKRKAFFLWNK